MSAQRGRPLHLRTDNGPEFISHRLQQWCLANNITIQYIQPGRPMQNAYVERKEWQPEKRTARCLPFFTTRKSENDVRGMENVLQQQKAA
ncbi:MAG: hypothetical protein C5B59_18470 [Bacteroidetes bacterium]|nr:MAG: hypothetical protein C5B59_18470 [Bacteroidota bacterium]